MDPRTDIGTVFAEADAVDFERRMREAMAVEAALLFGESETVGRSGLA
jgi:hypothetical protein